MNKLLTIVGIVLVGMSIAAPVRSMLGAKGIVMTSEAEQLPYDAQVEYVHFPSGAYIDTGMQICTAFGTRFIGRINKFNGSYDAYYGAYNGSDMLGFRRNGTTSNVQLLGYSGTWSTNITLGVKFTLEVSPENRTYRYIYLNGQQAKYITSVYYALFPLTLFIGATHHSKSYFSTSDFDFFGFKVWDYRQSPSLIMDLIPVRIGEDAYIYDKVSKRLFESIGTAKLGLGPDI